MVFIVNLLVMGKKLLKGMKGNGIEKEMEIEIA